MKRKIRIALVTLIALLAPFLLGINSANATYPTSPNVFIYGDQSSCAGNCSFYPGEFALYSVDGIDALAFGKSGNFAGYNAYGQQWFSAGTTSRGAELRLQTDGNVVVYDSGHPEGSYLAQQPLWASGTYTSTTYGTVNYHLYRITMGGSGHFSIWHKLVLDTTGNWTWERWKTFGNGL